jgi:hypothetical protein
MTDAIPTDRPAGVRATASDGGVDFELALDRRELLPGQLAAGVVRLTFQRDIGLPHGRSDAQLHVILARAWAPDTHLVRDVAICSTIEL